MITSELHFHGLRTETGPGASFTHDFPAAFDVPEKFPTHAADSANLDFGFLF